MNRRLNTDAVLTPAETRVASGYVAGMIGKEIADASGTSYNTVVRQTQSIYDKAGIKRNTNALVAWFLETNFGLDLSEFRRRVGAAILLCIIGVQMAVTDFDSSYVRQASARRVEARKAGRKGRRREEEDNTLTII